MNAAAPVAASARIAPSECACAQAADL